MIAAFDLFKEEANGTVFWWEAVSNVEAAKGKARELMVRRPGKYFVYCQTNGETVYVRSDPTSSLRLRSK